ncbi:MAG: CocE/NonD family hydrolase [Micromonosporaceae bacterium]|nr:CocE/NonD family hydrolase [Micromonosporaceae bacterium]
MERHMLSIPSRRVWRRLAVACSAVLALGVVPVIAAQQAGAATGAFDYTKIKNLSQPRYDYDTEVVRETLKLPMSDGKAVYLEVTRPKEKRQYPTILEASPYHGTLADRDGTRIFPEPRDADGKPVGLTGYFAPRGYAVVMMDLRGTGKSEGCLDHLGKRDREDLKAAVEWAASQPWSNGRVGMTGHSYVGSTPSAAAAMNPKGLATIVPSAGLASMYDHQFQGGVPYFLQWAGPMYAYEQLALERHLPGGENFGKNVEDTGCGLPNSSLVSGEDQLSGRYAQWHADRDWTADAAAADVPVFMVHGVNDNAARVAAMQWFTERGGRAGDKTWLGQWDHGSGCCPTRRGIQWPYALHAWFDKHLAQRKVNTGPAAEMFLSDGTFQGARGGDRSEILTSSAWPPAGASTLALYPDADNGGLGESQPDAAGSASFTGDPQGVSDPQGTGGVDFATAPMTSDTVLAGQPQLDLVASVTVERVHLIATLYDEFSDDHPDLPGERRRISQFAINPELRDGIDKVAPVVPGAAMTLKPQGFAMAHNLRAGHKLVLRVTASDPDKVPTFATDPRITVHTGPDGTALRAPVVGSPTLVEDTVPLQARPKKSGPAQATIKGSATPPLGGPEQVDGVTTADFEFDVEDGKDNAELIAGAVPAQQADIDLYLQRQNADGTWGSTVAAGTSGSLTSEQLRLTRPTPGRYRLVVHNWAGLPATRVDLTIEFVNSDGEPGPG